MSLCRGSIAKHRRANVAAEQRKDFPQNLERLTKSDRAGRERFWVKYFSPIDKIPDNPPCPHNVAKRDISYKATKQLTNLANTNQGKL